MCENMLTQSAKLTGPGEQSHDEKHSVTVEAQGFGYLEAGHGENHRLQSR